MKDPYPIPGPFMFIFPEGAKWSSEMTRDELLRVIGYLQGSQEFWKAEAHKSLREWAQVRPPKPSFWRALFG